MGNFCLPDDKSFESEIVINRETYKAEDQDNISISQIDDKSFKDFVMKSCNLRSDLDSNDFDLNKSTIIKIQSET